MVSLLFILSTNYGGVFVTLSIHKICIHSVAFCLTETRNDALQVFRSWPGAGPVETGSRSKDGNTLFLLVTTLGILGILAVPRQSSGALDVRVVPRSTANHVRDVFELDKTLLQLFLESNWGKAVAGLTFFIGHLPGLHTARLETPWSKTAQVLVLEAFGFFGLDAVVFFRCETVGDVGVERGGSRAGCRRKTRVEGDVAKGEGAAASDKESEEGSRELHHVSRRYLVALV